MGINNCDHDRRRMNVYLSESVEDIACISTLRMADKDLIRCDWSERDFTLFIIIVIVDHKTHSDNLIRACMHHT